MSEDDPKEVAYPLLAIYLLVLPEPVLLPHGSTWMRQLDEREPLLDGQEMRPLMHLPAAKWSRGSEGYNFVSLRFWQVRDDQVDIPEFFHRTRLADRVAQALVPDMSRDPDDLARMGAEDSGAYRTVVEAVTFVARSDDLFASADKPEPLTRCINVLTGYHRAYRVATRAHVPELTYERIHPAVLWFRRPALEPGARPEPAGMILLENNNVPIDDPTPISHDDVDYLTAGQVRAAAGDPFMVYAERRLEAEIEAVTNGRPRESVVQASIAAEVLLGAILGLAMWEEHLAGTLTTEGAAEILAAPLAVRVRTQYNNRLGGTWSPDTGLVRRWQTHIADVRHRVVHAGFEPTKQQAYAAMDALIALEHFLGDRLAIRWRTYPRTAWLFLGTLGFRQRGKNKLRQAQDWAAAEEMNLVEWIRDYQAWREQVNALVVRGR